MEDNVRDDIRAYRTVSISPAGFSEKDTTYPSRRTWRTEHELEAFWQWTLLLVLFNVVVVAEVLREAEFAILCKQRSFTTMYGVYYLYE